MPADLARRVGYGVYVDVGFTGDNRLMDVAEIFPFATVALGRRVDAGLGENAAVRRGAVSEEGDAYGSSLAFRRAVDVGGDDVVDVG